MKSLLLLYIAISFIWNIVVGECVKKAEECPKGTTARYDENACYDDEGYANDYPFFCDYIDV
ncbi:unnamed protein product [Cunninghamella blakesleeana]